MITRLSITLLLSAYTLAATAQNAMPSSASTEAIMMAQNDIDVLYESLPPSEVLPGSISRAFFANGIENREPKRVLNRIESSREEAYFFSELIDFTDQIVTHRWIFNGTVEAEIEFAVNGPRWRVWSRKTIPAAQRGLWQVDIIDQADMIIESYPIMAH